MCIQEYYIHTGCSCTRQKSSVKYCPVAVAYPNRTCDPVKSELVYLDARENRVCTGCLTTLKTILRNDLAFTSMPTFSSAGHACGVVDGADREGT